MVCRHGNRYVPHRRVRISQNIIIFKESGETVQNIRTYGIKTSVCSCVLQADTTDILLWNLGGGEFVDFLFLHKTIHNIPKGISIHGSFSARQEALKSLGINSQLTSTKFNKSVVGYASAVSLNPSVFLCPDCGESPKYLCCDGKMTGPTKKKILHLDNHDWDEEDLRVLNQGSLFKNRVFLRTYRERSFLLKLLRNVISLEESIASPEWNSDNGQLIFNLLSRLNNTFGEIPPQYEKLLENLGVETPISGWLQVLSNEPLLYLNQFCQQEIDLRDSSERQKLTLVVKELPALWPLLMNILHIENSHFLPEDVANIVSEVIKIRINISLKAPVRNDDDYEEWRVEDGEHPLQYYPVWRHYRAPAKYSISGKIDENICGKKEEDGKQFTNGVFSIGCTCPKNITYGYELMKHKSERKIIFQLLMCRDIDMDNLEGIIFDFACGLDAYLLNREPREFEFLRTLVDGSHWQSHRKKQKSNKRGEEGHFSCSDGYNFNLYKKHLPPRTNSQGREQLHAKMEKFARSLVYFDYVDYMNFLKIFFGFNNLKAKGEI